MKRLFLVCSLMLIATMSHASIFGDLRKAGIESDGVDVEIFKSGGDLTVNNDLAVGGNADITGDLVVTGSFSGSDGSTPGGDITLENSELITNTPDNTVEIIFGGATAALGTFAINSNSASPAVSDVLTFAFKSKDNDVTPSDATYATILMTITDPTSTTLDGTLTFAVQTAGTTAADPVSELVLTGAALTPFAAGELTLGTAALPFGASYFNGNMLLDDSATHSPSLTFTDETGETAVFHKNDGGYLHLTMAATRGLSIVTGNLKVGAGTADLTQNGDDAYFTGTFEADGATRLDGATVLTSTFELHGAATLHGNVSTTGTLSVGASATPIIGIVMGSIDLADESSDTATVLASGGTGYHVTTNFQTNSADAYVKTAAVSSTTLTVTLDQNTTGTLTYKITYW